MRMIYILDVGKMTSLSAEGQNQEKEQHISAHLQK